jgi:hypothetical protein
MAKSLHPTEKAFRPSHRASVNGCILHDSSYMAVMELKGELEILKQILGRICNPHGLSPAAARYDSRDAERRYPLNSLLGTSLVPGSVKLNYMKRLRIPSASSLLYRSFGSPPFSRRRQSLENPPQKSLISRPRISILPPTV